MESVYPTMWRKKEKLLVSITVYITVGNQLPRKQIIAACVIQYIATYDELYRKR